MGTPQDPPARAKQKARRRRKEARLLEKKAAAKATQTEAKKLPLSLQRAGPAPVSLSPPSALASTNRDPP